MSYSLGHYSFGGGGSSLQGGGYSYAADDAYASQQPYDDEADRSDVLKLVLYDLNSAIAPRDVRLMAIHAGEWGRKGTARTASLDAFECLGAGGKANSVLFSLFFHCIILPCLLTQHDRKALEEFDHDDEALHDEELELRADHILL